ncbi:halocyanin domain-containing protein [Haloglomus halophilum]|uniref:halocyanin domain-containing protein n=1 Tax=Haloglomus halophilum TaxID=2962672 RepID=UPI0020CA25C7|nr:halocyanin domain-containing protein [Haloglomus halophilum]
MTEHTSTTMPRRRFLRTAALAGTLAATGVGAGAGTAAAADEEFEAWFSNVGNYDGVADYRGQSEVSVAVGSEANGGAFGFGPAAIQVDPGTTVVWEWTGDGGLHNVAETGGAFESELTDEGGYTFEQAVETEGVHYYVCVPHEQMGMKGAVVVGDLGVGSAQTVAEEPIYGHWLDGVSNYDGTVDMTGREEIRIAVGTEGNGGMYAFDPPAVKVDSGTTVVWEWTGEAEHDVVDERLGYASPRLSEAGDTFSRRFEGEGISKYACSTLEDIGMKGAIVVGDPPAPNELPPMVERGVWGLLGLAVLSPLAAGEYLRRQRRPERREVPAAPR